MNQEIIQLDPQKWFTCQLKLQSGAWEYKIIRLSDDSTVHQAIAPSREKALHEAKKWRWKWWLLSKSWLVDKGEYIIDVSTITSVSKSTRSGIKVAEFKVKGKVEDSLFGQLPENCGIEPQGFYLCSPHHFEVWKLWDEYQFWMEEEDFRWLRR